MSHFISSPHRRILYILPKRLYQQKTCICLFLAFSFTIFFYFSSVSFENWTSIKLKITDVPESANEIASDSAPEFLQKFLIGTVRSIGNEKDESLTMAVTVEEGASTTVHDTDVDTAWKSPPEFQKQEMTGIVSLETTWKTVPEFKNQETGATLPEEHAYGSTSSAAKDGIAMETTSKPISEFQKQETTVKSSAFTMENMTSETLLDIEERYLVFSKQCRIPDIDPMHPSISHLIKHIPPLDCSVGHEPLTRTEGHVLFLNQTAVLERTAGENYTCCYRSVFRDKEGQSDNRFGFSKECIIISQETVVRDVEFMQVECSYGNDTTFYNEFHSFIFDKPKVEKRCDRAAAKAMPQPPRRYSVMIVGVDSVSRLNMHRQLNATARYLLREMDAVEMYGFNKVGDNTFPNLVPLLMGYYADELPRVCVKSKKSPLDRCDFVWKKYARKGYRTLYAEDAPHISSFNYGRKGFYLQPTDYYFRHFILPYEGALGRDKPMNCYLCVGSVSETEAVLQYTEQFASHFSARPHFSFSWINSATHDELNAGSLVDHMYERFFRTLHRGGALNDTVVILMGDHGMRWGSIRKTYVGMLEERLPMLLISLPPRFKREKPEFAEALRRNSRRLVTPFDLHATLVHLLDLERENWTLANSDGVDPELARNFSRRALSLFRSLPEDRSCGDASVEEHWCTCESSVDVRVTKKTVRSVARFIVKHVNGLLRPKLDKCASLGLDGVLSARMWQPTAGHSAEEFIYTVMIRTKPGEAVFEGTVKASRGTARISKKLLGSVSRLNLYGNQSHCVNDSILKKYCYCL